MTDGIPDTKLMFKYVEVGRFDKTDEELTSLSDKWMYVLKNLSRLDNRPAALREKICWRFCFVPKDSKRIRQQSIPWVMS